MAFLFCGGFMGAVQKTNRLSNKKEVRQKMGVV
jgi:hypothetical protein